MRLKAIKTTGHPLTIILGAICLAYCALPAAAFKYNDGNSTNYLAWATNDFRLKVGVDEPGNALYVTNGGVAAVTEVYVGESTASVNNLLSVTNGGIIYAGAVDTNNVTTGGVYVGDTDGNGSVLVNNSSELDTDYLYLGKGADESGTVDVTGGGLLNIREQLYVGSTNNSDNALTISDDGAVFVNETSDLIVANIDGATNDFNEVNVESSGRLLVGGDVNATTFTSISNLNFKAGAILGVGGALTINNSAIEDSLNIILDNDLSASTAQWNSTEIYIGDSTKNNSLTLTNGATATAAGDIIYIGNKTASSGNSLNVYGTNSLLTAQDKVLVGNAGDNNSLNIDEGGSAIVSLDLKVGESTGAERNSVFVGADSTLTVNRDLVVGANGNRNTMTVEDGEVAVLNDFILGSSSINNRYNQTGGTNTVSGAFMIGRTTSSSGVTTIGQSDTSGNLATIGEGATLNIQEDLTVGQEGNGSVLLINDGGIVNVAGSAVIGNAADDNYIYLQPDDPDSRLHIAGNLVVGGDGENNRFAVYGGTANIDGNLYLGSSTNQHVKKNYIHLETTNAVLNVANSMYIGASNSVNTLDLAKGATANMQNLFVGTYAGVSNNVVTVSGDDSLLNITNSLAIGSATGENNSVTVRNGGILNVDQANIDLSGTNNILKIADGGTLKTHDWDFSALTGDYTNIVFEAGYTLHLLGALSGTNEIAGGANVVLDGTNATWNTGTNNLIVGNTTQHNSLTLTNGASVATASNLYMGVASYYNTVEVAGVGSALTIGNDLYIGDPDENDSGYNDLYITGGGMVSVGNNASLVHAGTLKIDSVSRMTVAGGYEQDQYSTLDVGVSTNQTTPNLTVSGTANFEGGSTISVFNDGLGKNDTNVVQNIVLAGNLTIDGKAATSGLLLDQINIETNLLLGFDISVSNSTAIVLDNFIVRSLGEAAGLSGQLLAVANEIEAMSAAGITNATTMLDIIDGLDNDAAKQAMDNHYGEKMSSTPAHNAINIGIQSVAEEVTKRADSTRVRMGVASSSAIASQPLGAEGPHSANQELQGWFTGFGTWVDKKAADGFDAYDGNISGFMLGADLSVADGILFGIAGGSGSSTLDKDNGASTDTRSLYGSVYASLGTKDWFADAGLIYGSSRVDINQGPLFDTEAKYDARNYAFYFGGGKEIIGDYLIVTPQASILGNYYKQDSYTEESSTAVPREVDSFDTFYLQSALGCNVGMYATIGEMTIKPEVFAFWLHEFNAKEEDLTYNLSGNANNFVMTLQAPEEDIIKLGAGVSTRLGDYLELRAAADTRFGQDYSDYTLLGSIRYQF